MTNFKDWIKVAGAGHWVLHEAFWNNIFGMSLKLDALQSPLDGKREEHEADQT